MEGPLRPQVMSTMGMVATGHYLATSAGLGVLASGGNAVDAGVAAGLALNVVHNDMCSLSGVAPIILYLARERRVANIAGVGTWPAAASLETYRERWAKIPDWPLSCVVPASADAWLTCLRKYGTMSLAQVSKPALDLAEQGHALFPFQHYNISHHLEGYRKWPENARIFLRNGEPPPVGTVIRQPDLARTLRRLLEAEEEGRGAGREAAIGAARDLYYRGEIARAMVEYCRSHGGIISEADFASYQVKEETPCRVRFGEVEVWGCGPWSQGTVILQALGILDNFDLRPMGHNTPRYVHTVAEALKLAFADRERFCGDPDFVDVPIEGLLSPTYLRARSGLIDPQRAWPDVPPAGDPRSMSALPPGSTVPLPRPFKGEGPADESRPSDTSCVTVIDGEGNLFSATPSDGYTDGGIVPGLGLHVSQRGSQSRLDPESPNCLHPGKRPRLTPNPILALREGRPFIAMSTPGNDRQPQAMLQVLLNVLVFGMGPQAAVEAPRFASYSFPSTTSPHGYYPGRLCLEREIAETAAAELGRLGHEVREWDRWTWSAGGVCLSMRDPSTGVLYGGADPRREGYALGL